MAATSGRVGVAGGAACTRVACAASFELRNSAAGASSTVAASPRKHLRLRKLPRLSNPLVEFIFEGIVWIWMRSAANLSSILIAEYRYLEICASRISRETDADRHWPS
jgi:hypothetical protein